MGTRVTLAEDSLSDVTVKKWSAKSKQRRNNTNDDPPTGRPKASTADEDAIYRMVLGGRRLTVQQIATSIGISSGSAHIDLTEILRLSKISARILTPEKKLKRVNLKELKVDLEHLLRCLNISQDETWFTTSNLNQIFKVNSEDTLVLYPRISSMQSLLEMWRLFFYSEGIIMIEYLEKRKTINRHYYGSEWRKLKETIKSKRIGNVMEDAFLF